MKIFVKTFCVAALWMALAATGYSQGVGGDHFTIPLNDPARPASVNVNAFAGSISVKGYDGNEIIVDTKYMEGQKPPKQSEADTTGLKRITSTSPMIDVENNTVNIRTGPMSFASDITLQVPKHTMLVLKKIGEGDITVEQVRGEIEVNNINGNVNLSEVSGSVVAHALNGSVKVTLLDVEPDTPSSFSSMNGNVDVSLPADLKANLSIKTMQGDIFSGFDVKTDPNEIQNKIDESRKEGGDFEISVGGTLRGTINGGGSEMQFKTFNGNIYIRKLSR